MAYFSLYTHLVTCPEDQFYLSFLILNFKLTLTLKMKILACLIPALLFLSESVSMAQVGGCTDRLAVNYDKSASFNDGSCYYDPANMKPLSGNNLESVLSETSGLVYWNNVLLTHNDNSDTNIYCLDTLNGAILRSYKLTGVKNTDWEEISQDKGFIYIGDFGNNCGDRKDLKILKISKTSLLNDSPIIDSIRFSYSNQSVFNQACNNNDFDCEAFIVSDDSIYLFTKQWAAHCTSIYSLPKSHGDFVAKYRSTLDVNGLVTGATYSESDRIIALSGYSDKLDPFVYLLYDFRNDDFLNGNKRKIEVLLPFHQTEGIARGTGLKYYISNEYFSAYSIIKVQQQLNVFDFSPFLGNYLKLPVPVPDEKNNFIISPVPSHDFLKVKSFPALLPADYNLISISGQIVRSGLIVSEVSEINVSGLNTGIYFLKIGAQKSHSYKVIIN